MQLPADASVDKAAALAALLPDALAQSGSGAWRIDASGLQHLDSATIALLMQARRLAQAAGHGFEVTGAPAKLRQLATLYGVQELLGLHTDGPAAAG